MATLEEFKTQVSADVEKEKPLNKNVDGNVSELTDEEYDQLILDRANELLLYIHNLFLEGHFNNEFKNNFYKSKIRYRDNDTRIEINFTNMNGVLNA